MQILLYKLKYFSMKFIYNRIKIAQTVDTRVTKLCLKTLAFWFKSDFALITSN